MGSIPTLLAGDLVEDLIEGALTIGFGTEHLLGAQHAREAGGGGGDDAQEADGFGEGFYIMTPFNEAAHADTQHVDLVLHAGEGDVFEVVEFGALEAAGVEAVLEGVGVAGRRAAGAFIRRRGGGVGVGGSHGKGNRGE